ncbi:MAG: glycosyltransferase, partial [Opitutales bacterium]
MPPAPPPRLITVTHEFHPHRGGIAVYTAEMAAAATELGYQVEVWAPALLPGLDEPDWPFTVRRLPIDGTHGLRSQWRMARAIHRNRQRCRDAVLYVPEPGPILALLLLQFFDTLPPGRLILTLHGSEILQLALRTFTRWSARRIFDRADRISVVSRYAEKLLLDFFPNTAGKTVLTPGA